MKRAEAIQFLEKAVGTSTEVVEASILRSREVEQGLFAFRLKGDLLKGLEYPREPFGIFYIASDDFIGFHIRFEDVARGGLRTVVGSSSGKLQEGALGTFSECYDLAWTQEFKNKDIPEGGSKGIIFITNHAASLEECQKNYIRALFSLLIGYIEPPEYLFLGPDERMGDQTLEWIGEYSKQIGYALKGACITSRLSCGINHKEYGVTSSGLMECVRQGLDFCGINSTEMPFTLKMAGGPDGDVAGNFLRFLEEHYSKRAKLLCIKDISGLLYDPAGLDLHALVELFHQRTPIAAYPRDQISSGGFFERPQGAHYETFLHGVPVDLFVPCGGRRKTLNDDNIATFFQQGVPSAKLIVEGANVYLSQGARDILERQGTVIIRDSSANKGGVICSSYEVFAQLTIGEEGIRIYQCRLAEEILTKINHLCGLEMALLLREHKRTGAPCSLISKQISVKILEVATQIRVQLTKEEIGLAVRAFALPLVAELAHEAIDNLPDSYAQAIAAKFIASRFVYLWGLDATPPVKMPIEVLISEEKSALK